MSENHGWSHSICGMCWAKMYPDLEPYRILYESETTCCFCGKKHASGIFIRRDPKDPEVKCQKQ